MKSQKILLEHTTTTLENSKDDLIYLIDDHINHCKKQHLLNWESDHSTSDRRKESRIQSLERAKKTLSELLSSTSLGKEKIQYSIVVEIATPE